MAEEAFERVRAFHQTDAYKKAMNKRKVWVEPLFAEAKDWHGMRRFRLRLLWRVNIEVLMKAAGQNLKRLLKNEDGDAVRFQQRPCMPSFCFCVASLSIFAGFSLLGWVRIERVILREEILSLPTH